LTRSRSRSPKNERAPGRPAFEPDLVKTFSTRGLADQWASAREGEIAKAEIVDYRAAEKVTLAELCQRYADENFEPKTSDSYRVLAFKRQPFAEKSLSAVQPADIIAWRNQRLKEGFERGGVLKDLQVLSKIIKTARTQWKISLASNPASAEFVPRPTLTEEDERDRTLAPVHIVSGAEEVGRRMAALSGKDRLKAHLQRVAKLHSKGVRLVFHPDIRPWMEGQLSEECALLRAARYPHWYLTKRSNQRFTPLVKPGIKARQRGPKSRIWAIISFAIETAMRRGEVAKLRWEHVHLDKGYLALPAGITKARRKRIIPLSTRALRILKTQPKRGPMVFVSAESIEAAYERVMARCGAYNLHFHDLRHEGTTRLVQGGDLCQLAVGKITGHRDFRTLSRYFNPTPAQIVQAYRTSRRCPHGSRGRRHKAQSGSLRHRRQQPEFSEV
jgi:hypothetical protein